MFAVLVGHHEHARWLASRIGVPGRISLLVRGAEHSQAGETPDQIVGGLRVGGRTVD